MPYRTDIPGQISELQLRAIEVVATLVPQNGCVVEVGSLFGLSSWAWAKSVPSSASVYCVDPWEGNEGSRRLAQTFDVKYGLEQFLVFTKDCPNIIPVQAYSPVGIKSWDRPVDLYYEDAVHNNPTLDQNIEFWTSHLTPNGIVCGDDYRPRFPDVRAAAERQAAKAGRKLCVVDFFWCVLPDPAIVPAAAKVRHVLADLAKEVAYIRGGTPARIHIGPVLPLPATIDATRPAIFAVRTVNDGATAWPAVPGDNLKLRSEIFEPKGNLLASTEHDLGVAQLGYDEPVDRRVHLPIPDDVSGDVRLRISLAGSDAGSDGAASGAIGCSEHRLHVTRSGVAPSCRIGEIVSLAAGGAESVTRGKGWCMPERRHCWTQGIESELSIRLEPAGAGNVWLNLRLYPFVAAQTCKAQRLSILANDVEIFAGRLSALSSLSIPLQVAPGAPFRLRFIHPDAHRPSDANADDQDQRILGFAVEALALSTLPLTL